MSTRLERRKNKGKKNAKRAAAIAIGNVVSKFSMEKEMQRVVFDTENTDKRKNRIFLPGHGWVRPSQTGITRYEKQDDSGNWSDMGFDECKQVKMKIDAILIEDMKGGGFKAQQEKK